MDLSLLIPLLVIALGGLFMYFVGAVIIQSLRLSILQVKSDVKIKMDNHNQEIEHKQIYLEKKRLQLNGQAPEPEKIESKERAVTTLELSFDGETTGLKEILESLDWVRKFVILKDSILLDIEGERTPNQVINALEDGSKLTVTEVHFAKNQDKTIVRD